MSRRAHRATTTVKWAGVLIAAAFLVLLLIILAPLLVIAASVLLLVAWRKPGLVARLATHRRLSGLPASVSASPMRFAAIAFAATLPFAATAYAVGSASSDGSPAPVAPTPAVAAESSPPTATPDQTATAATAATATPRPTASPRPTSRPTPEPTPTPTPAPTPEPTEATTAGGELAVYFLDVGQGDATLLVAPDATMLIDTGRHDRSDVVAHLTALGVGRIDVVAITHAHADHIGQLDRVLGAFNVGEVWMSGTPHTTQTFGRAVAALEASSARYEEPRAGQTTTVGSLAVQVVHPARLTGDLHGDSLNLRISYGSISFLFTGDSEAATEAQMVARHGAALASTVYQIGHHGSRTSTTAGFLAVVRPEVAIWSAGAGNQYGHPHAEVTGRLDAAGIATYGTAIHGTVTVRTDGSTYSISTGGGSVVPAAPPPAATPAPPAPTPAPTAAAPPPSSTCQPGQVDINSAGHQELQLIIHIGPERAQQIPSLRPFSSVDAMTRISGIGAARIADIKAQGIACAG